ncbi:MAG: glycogen synthase [Vallitalea sp.]|jgi:starch synthase|nr:glycogen synthase [Vallitalea sp.]
MINDKLNILYASVEIAPFASTGGLGDVGDSLPEELANNGLNIARVMPKFKGIEEKWALKKSVSIIIKVEGKANVVDIYKYKEKNLTTYFVGSKDYFERDNYYGYSDDNIRFGLFSKAVLEMLIILKIKPNILHVNDWHVGLIPFILKKEYSHIEFYKDLKTVYTIHNLQYQGAFDNGTLNKLNLSYEYFDIDILEYYGKICYMKAGIICSDLVTTVSDNYAKEIQTPKYGYGLDGVLRKYKNKICGIVNGINYDKFNPQTDKYIYYNYNEDNVIFAKKENKHNLQKEVDLPIKNVPLIGMVSRLSQQKGIDLCIKAIEKLANSEIQFIILGTGEKLYEDELARLSDKYPMNVKVIIEFNQKIARQIYSSSDIFLMPSLFEPCGLSQIYSMRFGTVPIVRKTGGLADTVKPFNIDKLIGTGFVFEEYDVEQFVKAINKALKIYWDSNKWNNLINNCMEERFSWENSAKQYINKYKQLLDYDDVTIKTT